MTSFLSIKHFLYLFLEHQHPPPTINLSLRGFNLAVSSVFNEKKKKHFQGSNLSSSQSPWGEPPPTVRDMKLNCADGRCQNPVWQSRMGSPCSCVISPGLLSLCQTHISTLALRYQAAFGRSNVSCCFHWDAAPEVVQFHLTHTLWGGGLLSHTYTEVKSGICWSKLGNRGYSLSWYSPDINSLFSRSNDKSLVDTHSYFKLHRKEIIKKTNCVTDYSILLFWFLFNSRMLVLFYHWTSATWSHNS